MEGRAAKAQRRKQRQRPQHRAGESSIRELVGFAYKESPEFGLLIETMATTGARRVQLARLVVRDLQDDRSNPRLMMPSALKGKKVKRVDRHAVAIPSSLAAKLRKAADGRTPESLLLRKPDGAAWAACDPYLPFHRTVTKAGLDPKTVTAYALGIQALPGSSSPAFRSASLPPHTIPRWTWSRKLTPPISPSIPMHCFGGRYSRWTPHQPTTLWQFANDQIDPVRKTAYQISSEHRDAILATIPDGITVDPAHGRNWRRSLADTRVCVTGARKYPNSAEEAAMATPSRASAKLKEQLWSFPPRRNGGTTQ